MERESAGLMVVAGIEEIGGECESMHGRGSEEARKQLKSPHMRTVVPRDSDGSLSSTASSSPSFFFKVFSSPS